MRITELHKKIIAETSETFSRPYLSKLVIDGKIPFTEENGKKVFDFDEVIKTLASLRQRRRAVNGRGIEKEDIDNRGSEKTINSTKIMLQDYQGKLAKQKFDIESSKLVYREDVENKAFIIGRVIRDQMLSIPERLAGEVASSTDPREVKEIMYKEINQVLQYISNEKVLYD